MKRLIALIMTAAIAAGLFGCNEKNIVFKGRIKQIREGCILVSTSDNVGFGEAIVYIANDVEVPENFIVGGEFMITILPQMEAGEPAQVTAVKLESAND